MEKEKPYQPTKEEIKKGEEMMDRKQKKMSKMRAEAIKNIGDELFEKLKAGEYDLNIDYGLFGEENIKASSVRPGTGRKGSGRHARLSGKIGDHEVSIEVYTGYSGEGAGPSAYVKGEIDGRPMDMDSPRIGLNAVKFFDKYCEVANLQSGIVFAHRAMDEIRYEDQLERKKKEWERKNFNPYDQKYKKVSDLPEQLRDEFVDVEGGGFVKRSAADYGYDQAYDDAQEMLSIRKEHGYGYKSAEKNVERSKEEKRAREEEKIIQKKRLAAIEELRKEREPIAKKKILFIEDNDDNLESVEALAAGFTGEDYVVAKSLEEAQPHLGNSDNIITDRFFPASPGEEPSDNGLNILESYPDKTALITAGDTRVRIGDHKHKDIKCINIAYREKGRNFNSTFPTNTGEGSVAEFLGGKRDVKKRPVDWVIAYNFANGAYQSLEKLAGTDIFKCYYHGNRNLAYLFSKFACGSPAQVEELAYQEILSLGKDAQKYGLSLLRSYSKRYAFSVAETDNKLVQIMRKFWPQSAQGYSTNEEVGMLTSDDPDPKYERLRDKFIEVVDKLFEGSGCEVYISSDRKYKLSLSSLHAELMKNPETVEKVKKFEEKLKSLLDIK